jgi:hypothetical protein
MRYTHIRALCLLCVFAAPLFLFACSSSSGGGSESVEQDTTPPTIVAQYPASGAMGVSRTGPYWVAFSEGMNESMFPAAVAFAPGPATLYSSWRGDTLFVTPGMLLAGGTEYTITVLASCEDEHGNALGSDHAIAFTTTEEADVTPPTVVSTVPADGATGVLGSRNLEITFSEAMNTGQTWDAISADPEPSDGWSEWDGLTLVVHHTAFPQNTLVTITVGTGATDLSGNHLAAPATFSFRTQIDNTRPRLASAAPANGATGVPTSLGSIVLNFSESMDQNSFEMGPECVDARINQTVDGEPTANADFSSLSVPISKGLAAGCTYWVDFRDVTDGSGNTIDPNPTHYQFTTAGTVTYYPVNADAVWHLARSGDEHVTRTIANYNQTSGTFNEVFRHGDGTTQEIVHLKKTPTQIQHLGRDEYRDGTYQFSMTWAAPLPYIKLPVENYLGQSWGFSTTAAIDDSTTMVLTGTIQVDAATVDLVSERLHGTFKGCAVHHLEGDYEMLVHGNPVDDGHVHQILWLAPGVGPVQIVNTDGGSGLDTLRVWDWSM